MKFERMDLICTDHNEVLHLATTRNSPHLIPDGDPTADDFSGVWTIDFDDLICPQWVDNLDECQDAWTAQAVES